MNKIAVILLIIITGSIFYADDINSETDKMKTSFNKNKYQRAINSGIGLLNTTYQKFSSAFQSTIPDLSDFITIESNLYYNVYFENNEFNSFMELSKTFSNKNELINLSCDTTILNLIRYVSLLKSYDYLANKGNYLKISYTNDITNFQYLMDNEHAYIPLIFDEKNDRILSGIIVIFDFNFLNNLNSQDKIKIMDSHAKEFLNKLRLKDLMNYFE